MIPGMAIDITKAKIFSITDINKMYELFLNRSITVSEFDTLYDLELSDLQAVEYNVEDQLRAHQFYNTLRSFV